MLDLIRPTKQALNRQKSTTRKIVHEHFNTYAAWKRSERKEPLDL